MRPARFSLLSAAERAAALVDPGTFELLRGDASERSTLCTARGRIAGRDTVLVLTDGQQRGGTVGLVETRQFSEALATAERRETAVAVGWDTGGVRVQEGPAALAATSAIGVRLTQLALRGTPVVSIITGPRGCFGAPAVIAASGRATIMTRDAVWGLTGPALLETTGASAEAVRRVMSAAARRRREHVTEVVPDSASAIRRALAAALNRPAVYASAQRFLDQCVARTDALMAQLTDRQRAGAQSPDRRRDFLAYSFRGHWQHRGPSMQLARVDAAWGRFSGKPAMAVIVEPPRSREGFGVADANAVLHAVRMAMRASRGTPAPIIIFLFCRGHATTLADERAGLPRALGETLRGLIAARVRGHPLLCVLGGGAYGAAYLALAAPSHRVLAIRGTAVAPMAPRVLAAFQQLRGVRAAPATPPDVSRLIPEIRMVESVVRLPRVLDEELEVARTAAAAQPPLRRFALC